MLVNNLIEDADVGCEQGINATLLHCRHSVFCRLRHGSPLFAAIARLLAGCSVLHDADDILNPTITRVSTCSCQYAFMLGIQDSTPQTRTVHHDRSALSLSSLHAGNRLRTRIGNRETS